MANIYSSPEKFGLEIVGDVDFGENWFDMFVVFREKATGRLGYATDSGCSCPCPFEDHGVDDITFDEPWKIALAIRERANEVRESQYLENDVVFLIDKVVNA